MLKAVPVVSVCEEFGLCPFVPHMPIAAVSGYSELYRVTDRKHL